MIERDLFEAGLNEAAVGDTTLWAFKPSAAVFFDRGAFGDRAGSTQRDGRRGGVIENGPSSGQICDVARWFWSDIRAIGHAAPRAMIRRR
jgi:hypothetical protein